MQFPFVVKHVLYKHHATAFYNEVCGTFSCMDIPFYKGWYVMKKSAKYGEIWTIAPELSIQS